MDLSTWHTYTRLKQTIYPFPLSLPPEIVSVTSYGQQRTREALQTQKDVKFNIFSVYH